MTIAHGSREAEGEGEGEPSPSPIAGPVDAGAPSPSPIAGPRETRRLDRLLRDEGPLAPARALALLRPLARDLDRLHARGVIHGAVRPWIVMVGPDDDVALGTDDRPGVPSSIRAARSASATARPSAMAAYVTPGDAGDGTGTGRDTDYLSPQLLAGEASRPGDDLYALGVVAYELLTGATPFETAASASPSPARRPVAPRDRRPDLPPAVERVLLAHLSSALAGRFATGLELVRELERAVAPDTTARRPASIADFMSPPFGALPTFRRLPAGAGVGRLALAELPDGSRVPPEPPRVIRVRPTDYPVVSLPGLWVVVLVVVLFSVYLLPVYYILRGLLG